MAPLTARSPIPRAAAAALSRAPLPQRDTVPGAAAPIRRRRPAGAPIHCAERSRALPATPRRRRAARHPAAIAVPLTTPGRRRPSCALRRTARAAASRASGCSGGGGDGQAELGGAPHDGGPLCAGAAAGPGVARAARAGGAAGAARQRQVPPGAARARGRGGGGRRAAARALAGRVLHHGAPRLHACVVAKAPPRGAFGSCGFPAGGLPSSACCVVARRVVGGAGGRLVRRRWRRRSWWRAARAPGASARSPWQSTSTTQTWSVSAAPPLARPPTAAPSGSIATSLRRCRRPRHARLFASVCCGAGCQHWDGVCAAASCCPMSCSGIPAEPGARCVQEPGGGALPPRHHGRAQPPHERLPGRAARRPGALAVSAFHTATRLGCATAC